MTAPRFPWWPYLIALALIFVGAIAPIALTVYAANVAHADGCTVSNGLLTDCANGGVARAGELQAMANGFWYALVTWPLGILLAFIWLGVLFWHRRRWSRKAGFDA